MMVTEEVDALRIMGFEPNEFVLAPKYLAALIMVPCLSILSNVCGILAGGIFMFFSTHLGLRLYLHDVLASIQLRDVISAIRDNRPPAVTGIDGRRVVAIIQGVYESGKTGRPVKLSD